MYTYYKNTADKWDSEKKVTVLHALEDEEWDIITLQQAVREAVTNAIAEPLCVTAPQ